MANEIKAKAVKKESVTAQDEEALGRHRRELVGTVVSDKMQKTLVVKVDRRVKHTLYGKYVNKSIRYKAHDEKNTAKVGDLVLLVESRPLSRHKRWALKKILRRGGQALEVNI